MSNSITKVIQLNTESIYKMSETPNKKWVRYGRDNDFPEYLRDLYTSTPTHQSLINGISYIINSEGVKLVSSEDPRTNAFVNLQFTNELTKNISFDLKAYGYAVLKCYGLERIRKVEYSEAVKWRSGVKNTEGDVTEWYFSEDWNNSKEKTKKYNLLEFNEDSDVSVYVFQLPKIGFEYYAPVDYIAGINSGYIPLEFEIGNFHYSSILNGLAPSTLINFNNGIPSDEQMNQIEKDINKKWSGSGNAGRLMVNFNESKEQAATIETLQVTDLDKQYQFLSTESMEKILIAHRSYLVSEIFGLKSANGFSNNAEELKNNYNLWYDIVIKPFQKIITDGLEEILQKNMLFGTLEFEKYDPFKVEKPEVKMKKVEEPKIEDFEELKVQTDDKILIKQDVLLNKPKEDKYYKFVKASNRKSLFLIKMDLDSKKGIVYKSGEVIKNTQDYYFEELSYVKKIKE